MTNPEIVRAVHEDYIRAGADIITTNTYSTGPHVLRQMGKDGVIQPWNTASVGLARQAVGNAAGGREVIVAGSVSAFGNGAMRYQSQDGAYTWGESDARQLAANFREQIGILTEAGVDMVLLECLGANADDIEIGVGEALSSGLPVVASLSAEVNEDDVAVLSEVSTRADDIVGGAQTVGEAVRRIAGTGVTAICAMHSKIDEIDTILPSIRAEWPGIIGAYPNRTGFWNGQRWVFTEEVTPMDYADRARGWVDLGASIVGGCCGTTPDMIAAVSDALQA